MENNKNQPIQCLAAQGENEQVLLNCASGGAFYYIAKSFIENGGTVFGCKMSINGNSTDISHIRVSDVDQLREIIGSKYAQSDSYKCFVDIQKELISGNKVLFASTPCQVAALKSFLSKDFDNLLTIDIFCHGNTNRRLLSDYIRYLGQKEGSDIIQYVFRDKQRGKGYKAKYKTAKSNEWRRITTYQEAYWYLFQNAKILRVSCYGCRYASQKRVGDLSLGDFWGIEKTRPDIVKSDNAVIDNKYGISAILINSQKGLMLFNDTSGLKTVVCNVNDISKYGHAICKPTLKPNDRETILADYTNYGYGYIQKQYKKVLGIRYYKYYIREIPVIERLITILRSR